MWLKARYSFWFMPAVFGTAAVVLAIALIDANDWLPSDAFERWPLLLGAGADGARGLLTAVATSMITVAGVVFSITLVALSLASSQYTSRVLRNFLRDRVTQSVMGAFVGIFIYCLIVLRTIRGGAEDPFIPTLAVLVGLLLGFVGIGVLIYFIHHISMSIQASHILAATTAETVKAIDHLFPDGCEDEVPDELPQAVGTGAIWHKVAAERTGYVQSLDTEGLLSFASDRRTVVRMERGIGQFVIESDPIVAILDTHLSDEDIGALRGMLAIGRQRTVEQDPAFGIRQIVDIALKALSPGVNDTTTAVMCIDHLNAILVRLTDRRIESNQCGKDGVLRVLTCGPSYAGLVDESFDQIRQNAGGIVAVLERSLDALRYLAERATPARRAVLGEHARAVAELAERSVLARRDSRRIAASAARALQAIGAAVVLRPIVEESARNGVLSNIRASAEEGPSRRTPCRERLRPNSLP